MIEAATETIAKAATPVDRLRALLDASKEFYRKNPKAAEKWAREALTLAKKLKDEEAEARAHYRLGCALFQLNEYKDATIALHKAIEQDSSGDLKEGPYFALGQILSKQGKYSEAVEEYHRALRISREHQRVSQTDILSAMGNAALATSDYPKALEHQYAALALLDTSDNPLRRSIVLSNIGWIYLEVRHFDKAQLFFDRSHILGKALEDVSGLATVCYNRGLVAKEQENIAEAQVLFSQALEYAKSIDEKELEAYIEDALGEIALTEGKVKKAVEHYRKSIAIAKSINLIRVWCSSLAGKGRALTELKKHAEAILVLKQSLAMSEESGLLSLQTEAANALAKAYEKAGKLKEAVAAYNIFIELNGRLNSQQKQRELVEISARVEIEKSDRERARLEILANNAEARANILRAETERQSTELTQLALQLIEKNQFLCDLKEQMEPQLKSSRQAKALSQTIDDHIRSDRDWETFENQFNSVHKDFLARLSAKYPTLTPTELKIATMIKLNLSSKAIANLFCLSARTVENHRLSIRRKIGLNGDANLVSFFTAFGSENHATD